MESKIVMTQNWLTDKPQRNAWNSTLFLVLLLLSMSSAYLNDVMKASSWMQASGQTVFFNHQYWRAWTTLFAHGDFGHIISNLFLFIPFAFFLTGHFGYLFFPLTGFFVGGLVNLVVLKTMQGETGLIGVSGVVYWMGAAWITLSFLIDRRESFGKSLIKVTGISAILFIPETFQVNISYLSHFLGYLSGVLSGGLYYVINRKKFRAADVFKEIEEDEPYLEEE